MGGRLDPSIAAVRSAVRADLQALLADLRSSAELGSVELGSAGRGSAGRGSAGRGSAGPLTVLVACSGGADSTALAAAVAFEAPRLGVRAGAVTIDHDLQPGSAERAADLVTRMRGMGLEPSRAVTVVVPGAAGGPEAAARTARYAALAETADSLDACAVLLGHTADDQAETVLLGLARGSGIRSLAGMRAVNGRYRRPLLGLGRDVTTAACDADGLPIWTDPHNHDPRFTRVRVRHTVLPMLERELGPGIATALARTAEQARVDADALDVLAAVELTRLTSHQPTTDRPMPGLPVEALAILPPAIGTRLVRSWLLGAGAPSTDLGYQHVLAVLDLVRSWHGQRWIDVPGGLRVGRRDGMLGVAHRSAVAG